MDWLAEQIAPVPLSLFWAIVALTLIFTIVACLPHKWVERTLTSIANRFLKS